MESGEVNNEKLLEDCVHSLLYLLRVVVNCLLMDMFMLREQIISFIFSFSTDFSNFNLLWLVHSWILVQKESWKKKTCFIQGL